MKSDMLDKLKAHLKYLDTPEGQVSIKQYCDEIKAEQTRLDNHLITIHTKYHDKIDMVMERLINKYDSDKYRTKEYKLGYEPREELFWVMVKYAEKYSTECQDAKYWNDFTGVAYYLGSYVIQIMNGQGSVIRIDKQY